MNDPSRIEADIRLLRQANKAHRDTGHEDALRLYRELLLRRPALRPLLAPEIERCSRNLHRHRYRLPPVPSADPDRAAKTAEPPHQQFCRESLAQYLEQHPQSAQLPADLSTVPLVSVVMTSFNAEDTVQEAVESMLNQDWPNLEVLVCDDHSTDNTWEILSAMARRCKPLKVIRLNGNYGTYLAKNSAIRLALGDFIVFQDSDDISHPARVRMQVLPLLKDPKLMATRTKYLRYNESTGHIIPVAGLQSKYGLITVAVRKQAFKEIGYFDAVRKAGDDEWVQRLGRLYGDKSIKSLDLTLYAARLRENSLVADMMVFNPDGSVDQKASKTRWEYVNLFRTRHAQEAPDFYGTGRFPPFPLRPQKNYPPGVAALPIVQEKVFAAVCSIPQREKALLSTLGSLMHQVDRIYLYLDNYEKLPDYVSWFRRVTVLRSQDHPGLRDNAKFLMYDEVLNEQRGAPFYWFTVDDDIMYPTDYVQTLLKHLQRYENKAVVGLHGVVVDESPKKYFRHRYVYHYESTTLPQPRLVNNLGTGTVAFHSKLFGSIDPYAWPQGGMVDIFFSVLCARNGVPMVCVPRHAGWLKTLAETESTPSLIGEFRDDDRVIVDVLRANLPWGLARIRNTIARFDGDLRARLEEALPAFANEIAVRYDNYRNYLPGQPG